MLKPALNNFATQFSENFRSVFEDFSVDFSFIYDHLLLFLSSKVCTKSISRALTEWASQSLLLGN